MKMTKGKSMRQQIRNNGMVIVVPFVVFLYTVSVLFLWVAWVSFKENARYLTEGKRVPAELIGYKPVGGRQPGDRPVLGYVDHNGNSHIHLAEEYGVVGRYGKQTLPSRKIEITYLRNQPEKAVVEQWHSNFPLIACASFGTSLAFAATFLLVFVRKNNRQKTV